MASESGIPDTSVSQPPPAAEHKVEGKLEQGEVAKPESSVSAAEEVAKPDIWGVGLENSESGWNMFPTDFLPYQTLAKGETQCPRKQKALSSVR